MSVVSLSGAVRSARKQELLDYVALKFDEVMAETCGDAEQVGIAFLIMSERKNEAVHQRNNWWSSEAVHLEALYAGSVILSKELLDAMYGG